MTCGSAARLGLVAALAGAVGAAVAADGGATAADPRLVPWSASTTDVLAADAGVLNGQLAKARAAQERPVPAGDDIAVIVLDTVRADRLGVYGYTKATSPALDAWSKGARVYTRATSDAPWTLPAHASMFTGQYSRTHGAVSVGLADPRKAAPLRDAAVTFAEILRDRGYETVGIAANLGFLERSYGLSQGFDTWVCEDVVRDPRHSPYTPGDRMTAMALDYLGDKPTRPRLLFLNYMDAHAPWVPRDGLTREPANIKKDVLPFRKEWMNNVRGLMGKGLLDPVVATSWSEAYDADLRYLDQQMAQVLPRLADFEHVFILSDHGEALGEHTVVEHAKDVWQELVHVPFIARSARHPAGRDSTLVQSHDLAWMVLEAAKVPVPSNMVRTKDLVVAEQYYTLKKELENPVFGARFNHVYRAFRQGDTKVRVVDGAPTGTYDLARDPGELLGTVATPKGLDGVEARWLATTPEAPPVPVEVPVDENVDALRELGYVE